MHTNVILTKDAHIHNLTIPIQNKKPGLGASYAIRPGIFYSPPAPHGGEQQNNTPIHSNTARRVSAKMPMQFIQVQFSIIATCTLDIISPRLRSKFGERAFLYAGASVWNRLPGTIRQAQTQTLFKKLLKTFLFTKFYNCR